MNARARMALACSLIAAATASLARPLSDAETALLRGRSLAAEDLAARLGRENNDEALALLIELRRPTLLNNFANHYTRPATSAIRTHAMGVLGDPDAGPPVLRLVRGYQSRALFDALLAHIRSAIAATRAGRPGQHPNILFQLEAIARTELPAIEAELTELLPHFHPTHTRAITRLLVQRRYLPAEPAVVDQLRRTPLGQELVDTAWLVSGFETQSSLDAVTVRLVELRRGSSGTARRTPAADAETLSLLVNVLRAASPASQLARDRFTPDVIEEFPEPVRVQLRHLLVFREEEERAAIEITPANFTRWARAGNRTAQVKDFIARGAPLEGRDPAGDTALLAAVRSGNVEAVRLLLAAGANHGATDAQRRAPLHLLARHEGTATHAQLACAGLLVAAGADVSAKSLDNKTPLHYAVAHKFGEMTRLLVAGGADVNAEASEHGLRGLTPLQVALRKTGTRRHSCASMARA